ncbi:hypothetical protein Glove_230g188 [Diversispora epigaea]|uniref:Uncharacterized protein n=1 Tax=Diversispora epigaea TaxID=1348612 RepID=A0A397IKM4_9GLOM|nr:hypothetical protein Glove_230g188 [Diversispora epigaea]
MTDAHINLYKKNLTFALTWGTASFKNYFGEATDFSYKYFNQSHHIKDFSESNVVKMSKSLCAKENLREEILIYYHFTKKNFDYAYCYMVIPDGYKPHISVEGKTLFVKMSAIPTQSQKSGNVTRTASHSDVENYILKKYQSELKLLIDLLVWILMNLNQTGTRTSHSDSVQTEWLGALI